MVFAAAVLNPASAPFFFSPNASGDATVGGDWILYSQALIPMPVACIFDSLYVNAGAVPPGDGGGGSVTITLWVNGVAKGLSVTVDNTNGAAAGNQTGASIPVSPGDTIALQATGNLVSPIGGEDIIATSLHCQ
jgi:hypothetical protein